MTSKYTEQNADKVKEAHSTLYAAGLEMRNKVAGKEYVDRASSPLFPPRHPKLNSHIASNRSSMGKHLDTTRSRSQNEKSIEHSNVVCVKPKS
jgi:hypothetical protein